MTLIEIVRSNAAHVVLTGVASTPFRVTSHLYKNRHLAPTVVPLLQGQVEGQGVMEPVAWVNTAEDRRVFYTSLGNVDDFKLPAFRRLLLNGVLWCLHDPVPPPTHSPRRQPPKPPGRRPDLLVLGKVARPFAERRGGKGPPGAPVLTQTRH